MIKALKKNKKLPLNASFPCTALQRPKNNTILFFLSYCFGLMEPLQVTLHLLDYQGDRLHFHPEAEPVGLSCILTAGESPRRILT